MIFADNNNFHGEVLNPYYVCSLYLFVRNGKIFVFRYAWEVNGHFQIGTFFSFPTLLRDSLLPSLIEFLPKLRIVFTVPVATELLIRQSCHNHRYASG